MAAIKYKDPVTGEWKYAGGGSTECDIVIEDDGAGNVMLENAVDVTGQGKEMKTLNGYEVVDAKTREDVEQLSEAVRELQKEDEDEGVPETIEYLYDGDNESDAHTWVSNNSGYRHLVKVADIPDGELDLIGGEVSLVSPEWPHTNYTFVITEEMCNKVSGLTQILYQNTSLGDQSLVTMVVICTEAGDYNIFFNGWEETIHFSETGIYFMDGRASWYGRYVESLICERTNGKSVIQDHEERIHALERKEWEGKKWAAVGDSLTETNIRTTKNYHDYIAEKTGVSVVNMGVGGSGYKNLDGESLAFYQRILNVPTDVDVVTIFGSGNDLYPCWDNYGLGKVTDTGTDTICGCINTTIDNLYSVLPAVQLGIITPTPWDSYPTGATEDPENRMALYSDALVEICKLRGIPCLDLYRCSALRPWDQSFKNVAYSKDDGGGVHPDEVGHAIIAPRIKAFLESLML